MNIYAHRTPTLAKAANLAPKPEQKKSTQTYIYARQIITWARRVRVHVTYVPIFMDIIWLTMPAHRDDANTDECTHPDEEDLFMVSDLLSGGDLRYHLLQEVRSPHSNAHTHSTAAESHRFHHEFILYPVFPHPTFADGIR